MPTLLYIHTYIRHIQVFEKSGTLANSEIRSYNYLRAAKIGFVRLILIRSMLYNPSFTLLTVVVVPTHQPFWGSLAWGDLKPAPWLLFSTR